MVAALVVAFGVGMAAASAAPEAAVKEEQVAYKHVTGLVSGVGAKFIAVESPQSAKSTDGIEMAFPLDDKAQLVAIKSLKDLHLGDYVDVEYRETIFKDKTDYDQTKSKRVATKITLMKAALVVPDAPNLSEGGEAQ